MKNRRHLFIILFVIAVFLLSSLLASCGSQAEPAPAITPTFTPAVELPDSQSPPVTEPVAGKKKADSLQPAAGICAESAEDIVYLSAGHDNPPSPRCVALKDQQSISFINQTETDLRITFAGYDITLQPGNEILIDRPVGEYLEQGVHHISVVGAFLPEIWLK
jgi:hypothetical protein